MPPFYRRRFRGWDWFTIREIRHLPWRERERVSREALKVVRRHPRFWLMEGLLPFLSCLLMASLVFIVPLLEDSLIRLICLFPILLCCLALLVVSIVWHHRCFRQALRQELLDAGLRPSICFECGYNLEGYEGNECPACDALLLRQAVSPPEKS